VADPAVGADLGEPLDRLLAVAAQVALDLDVGVDVGAELRDLLVGQVADLRVRAEAELGRDLLRGRLADAEDVGQPDLEPLLIREIDSGDARDGSALPLLVPWVGADDHGAPVPLDHAAALTHGLDGRTDFHLVSCASRCRDSFTRTRARRLRPSRGRTIIVAERLRPS
jgi:hypothetical protein